MAILAERKRVIDVFAPKELMKASPTMVNNTSVYRALTGEKVYKEGVQVQETEVTKQYNELLSKL